MRRARGLCYTLAIGHRLALMWFGMGPFGRTGGAGRRSQKRLGQRVGAALTSIFAFALGMHLGGASCLRAGAGFGSAPIAGGGLFVVDRAAGAGLGRAGAVAQFAAFWATAVQGGLARLGQGIAQTEAQQQAEPEPGQARRFHSALPLATGVAASVAAGLAGFGGLGRGGLA